MYINTIHYYAYELNSLYLKKKKTVIIFLGIDYFTMLLGRINFIVFNDIRYYSTQRHLHSCIRRIFEGVF